MRNPRKRRNLSIAAALVGVGYMVVVLAVLHLDPKGRGTFASLVAASMLMLAGVTGMIAYQVMNRRRERLLRGERLLAKWMVTPEQWSQFRENEAKRPSRGRDNALRKVGAAGGGAGIDVVITEESLMVDGDFYFIPTEMRGLHWLDETPPCLDFIMVTRGKGSSVTWHIRFPAMVADGSARVVWDYYQKTLAPRELKPLIPRMRVVRWVSLLFAIISALLLLFAKMNYSPDTYISTPALTALVAGAVGLPSSLAVAAISHWWVKRGAERSGETH